MHIKKIGALTASFIVIVSIFGCGSSNSSNQLDTHNSDVAIVSATNHAE